MTLTFPKEVNTLQTTKPSCEGLVAGGQLQTGSPEQSVREPDLRRRLSAYPYTRINTPLRSGFVEREKTCAPELDAPAFSPSLRASVPCGWLPSKRGEGELWVPVPLFQKLSGKE